MIQDDFTFVKRNEERQRKSTVFFERRISGKITTVMFEKKEMEIPAMR